MTKTKDTTREKIERLVNKYPWPDSKELFRAELVDLIRQERERWEEEND